MAFPLKVELFLVKRYTLSCLLSIIFLVNRAHQFIFECAFLSCLSLLLHILIRFRLSQLIIRKKYLHLYIIQYYTCNHHMSYYVLKYICVKYVLWNIYCINYKHYYIYNFLYFTIIQTNQHSVTHYAVKVKLLAKPPQLKIIYIYIYICIIL